MPLEYEIQQIHGIDLLYPHVQWYQMKFIIKVINHFLVQCQEYRYPSEQCLTLAGNYEHNVDQH